MESFSLIEIVAATLGVINVLLVVRQKVINYPFGIAMVILYAVIFYDYKLYAESSLQIVWVGMQLYGWWFWLFGNKVARDAVPVTRLARKGLVMAAIFVATATIAIGFTLDQLTDAVVPYQDAFITTMSLAAQWMLDRKKMESWIVWIFVDVFSIGLYFSRSLYLTTGLYAVFLVLAISGLFAWQRSHKLARAEIPTAGAIA
jgi:nicotinamide mononucleotide transporter